MNKINYGYRKSIREQIKKGAKIYSLYEKHNINYPFYLLSRVANGERLTIPKIIIK